MSDSSKQSVYVRFEKETHERLQKLSQQSGDSTTKLVRMLVERALEQDMSVEILARTQAIAGRLGALEHRLGKALPTLHERLGALEQLVCTADANAARRSELDHAKQRNFWCSSRYGIWELQTVIVHVLEYALLTDGHSREVSRKLHADCQDASSVSFKEFLATIDAECAEIDAGAPAAIQPPPAVQLEPVTSDPPGADELTSWLAAIGGDEPKALAALRRLLTEPASPMAPQPWSSPGKGQPDEAVGPDQPGLFETTNGAETKPQTRGQRTANNHGGEHPNGSLVGRGEVVS